MRALASQIPIMHSAFISHTTPDDGYVAELESFLRALGFRDVFNDVHAIAPDEKFWDAIQKGIEECDVFCVVISSKTKDSTWVDKEVEFARGLKKRVVPIWIEGEPPATFKDRDVIDFRPETRKIRRRSIGDSLIPQLTNRFVERPTVLHDLKARLLPQSSRLEGGSRSLTRAVICGEPGAGKTVVANAFAHDPEVLQRFFDGVLWVELGQTPDLRQKLIRLAQMIPDPEFDEQLYIDVEAARAQLRSVLRERAFLIVVDDAWDAEHIEQAFLIGGPKCLLLITTRQGRIATAAAIAAEKIELTPMAEGEALDLLSRWAGVIAADDRAIARQLAGDVGYLPLALELIGAGVGTFGSWPKYLERWKLQRVQALKRGRSGTGRRDNARDSFALSVDFVSAGDRSRYMRLGIFSGDFPAEAAATLWNDDLFDATDLLVDFAGQALLWRKETPEGLRFRFHDLLHEFVVEELGEPDVQHAHESLLAAYRARGGGDWASVPDDGYFSEQLSHHLIQAGRKDELITLLTASPAWMNAKWIASGSDASFAVDVQRVLALGPDPATRIRLHALRRVIAERLGWLSDTDLRTLVWRGRDARALAQARLRSDAADRFRGLMAVAEECFSKGDRRPQLIDELAATAHAISEGAARSSAFRELGRLCQKAGDPRWSDFFEKARVAAGEAEEATVRWKALLDLAGDWYTITPARGLKMLDAARAVAAQMTSNYRQEKALREIAIAYARWGHPDAALKSLALDDSADSGFEDALVSVLVACKRGGTLTPEVNARVLELVAARGDRRLFVDLPGVRACIHALSGELEALERELGQWDEHQRGWKESRTRRCLVAALVASGDIKGAVDQLQHIRDRGDLADALEDIASADASIPVADVVSTVAAQLRPREKGQYLVEDLIRHSIRAWRLLFQLRKPEEVFRFAGWLHDSDIAPTLVELLPELDRMPVASRSPLLDQAQQIVERMTIGYWQEQALRALALAFAKAGSERADGCLERALAISRSRREGQGVDVLFDLIDVFASHGNVDESRVVVKALKQPLARMDALCALAQFLFEKSDARFSEVLTTAIDTLPDIKRDRDLVKGMTRLISVLGRVNDPRWREFLEKAVTATWGFSDDSLFKDDFEDRVARDRSEALARLVDGLAGLDLFDDALAIAETIPDRQTRAQRRAHLALLLARAGDPRSDALFTEAKAGVKEDSLPGVHAETARILIVTLAGAGRFDEAREIARGYIREDDRSEILATFARMLVDAGRLEEASHIAHSIALPSQRARALAELAVALAKKGDARSDHVFDEVRELSETAELPDRRASCANALAHALARAGNVSEAERVALTIPMFEFRSDAMAGVADALQETNPDRAQKLRMQALVEARSIPERERRTALLGRLFDQTARTLGIPRALDLLEVDSIDQYIRTLARWAPWLRSVNPELPAEALRGAIGVAAWIRDDWRGIQRGLDEEAAV